MAQNTGARSLGNEDTNLGRHTHDDRRGGLDASDDGRETGRTPAQWYCLLAGLGLLLAGIFGFIADASFDTAGSSDGEATGNANGMLQGDSFLGFEVNGWHNVVHLLSGLVLLSAFSKRKPAKTVALAFGIVYGIVTIIGMIDGNDVLGILPVNPADNILHLLLSLAGIISALASPTDEHRHGHGGGNVRHGATTTEARPAHTTGDATTVRTEPGAMDEGRFGRDVDPLTGRQRDDSSTTRQNL